MTINQRNLTEAADRISRAQSRLQSLLPGDEPKSHRDWVLWYLVDAVEDLHRWAASATEELERMGAELVDHDVD